MRCAGGQSGKGRSHGGEHNRRIRAAGTESGENAARSSLSRRIRTDTSDFSNFSFSRGSGCLGSGPVRRRLIDHALSGVKLHRSAVTCDQEIAYSNEWCNSLRWPHECPPTPRSGCGCRPIVAGAAQRGRPARPLPVLRAAARARAGDRAGQFRPVRGRGLRAPGRQCGTARSELRGARRALPRPWQSPVARARGDAHPAGVGLQRRRRGPRPGPPAVQPRDDGRPGGRPGADDHPDHRPPARPARRVGRSWRTGGFHGRLRAAAAQRRDRRTARRAGGRPGRAAAAGAGLRLGARARPALAVRDPGCRCRRDAAGGILHRAAGRAPRPAARRPDLGAGPPAGRGPGPARARPSCWRT